MAESKVETVMCASRLPAVLVARIDSAAKSGGVSRAQFIAEACRKMLDGPSVPVAHPAVATPEPVAIPARLEGVKMNPAMEKFLSTHKPTVAVEPEAPPARKLCGFLAFNDIDGETYTCGLPEHGPKVKHGAWVLA